jgi:Protein of unknown function (DUF3164).
MEEIKQKVEMSAEELAEFERYKEEKVRREGKARAKENWEVYARMVDEEIARSIPELQQISGKIREAKERVLDNFKALLEMKGDVLGKIKDGQKSHTFTNSEGDMRITIGRCYTDGWRDTVDDGIAMVKEAVLALVKDPATKALVDQILRLLSRDKEGNLKANKVLQLDRLAADLNNERLNEGITIIKEAHLPTLTKTYIRAEYKDDDGGWHYIPLGMTEA